MPCVQLVVFSLRPGVQLVVLGFWLSMFASIFVLWRRQVARDVPTCLKLSRVDFKVFL